VPVPVLAFAEGQERVAADQERAELADRRLAEGGETLAEGQERAAVAAAGLGEEDEL
jgi:hypothetical protein